MASSSTTYRGKWNSGETTVVRVPRRLAPEILRHAHRLDEASAGAGLEETAAIYRTASDIPPMEPVNVASVPQRSPFRYPGGKTWLVPYIRSWLGSRRGNVSMLVEPFAGGGIVGLTAGLEQLADHVILVESDPDVGAVWQAILGGHSEWLARRIAEFDLTRESAVEMLGREPTSLRERAFATILRNRVQRGGIMARGAGLVKSGENGRGLRSRWYPETLARRIRDIARIRHRLSFVPGDGVGTIRAHADVPDAAFFVDPPYTVAARRLYREWHVDHRELLRLLSQVQGDVLLTYDHTREVVGLAEEFGFEFEPVAMKNTHHARMTELLIGKDLSWLRRNDSVEQTRMKRGDGRMGGDRL